MGRHDQRARRTGGSSECVEQGRLVRAQGLDGGHGLGVFLGQTSTHFEVTSSLGGGGVRWGWGGLRG